MHKHFTRSLYTVQPFCFLMLLTSLFLTSLGAWAQSGTQTFTSNSTFTVPPGVTSITVECWGGGGKGGSTPNTNGSFAGGGGGGAYVKKNSYPVTPGVTYTIT
ncbi:MAG: hypothetical protein LW707_07285, partial [Sphingobacteriales bacterium]|nr:hypothetical protein [Sphingobacteriales bacterium]